jgi:hypothetical protein
MEVLRFDSRLPSTKYQHVIEQMRAEIPMIPVICTQRPAETWHSLVNRLLDVPGVPRNWVPDAVAPAA